MKARKLREPVPIRIDWNVRSGGLEISFEDSTGERHWSLLSWTELGKMLTEHGEQTDAFYREYGPKMQANPPSPVEAGTQG